MRTIKFRAWDTLFKEMVYDVQYKREERTFDQYLNDRYTLMQFTGITDKNGKEIFEGDIVHNERFDDLNGEWVGVIEYLHCGFQVCQNHIPALLQWRRHVKVIGNIYENPDSLEVVNDTRTKT